MNFNRIKFFERGYKYLFWIHNFIWKKKIFTEKNKIFVKIIHIFFLKIYIFFQIVLLHLNNHKYRLALQLNFSTSWKWYILEFSSYIFPIPGHEICKGFLCKLLFRFVEMKILGVFWLQFFHCGHEIRYTFLPN